MDRLPDLKRQLLEPLDPPTPTTLRQAASEVMEWALADFFDLADRHVGYTPSPAELASIFQAAPPDVGRPSSEVIEQFRTQIVPNTLRLQHPRFLGFVPTAPSYASMLADWLTSSANCFAGVWLEGAAATQIELVVLGWVRDWLEMPPSTEGLLTSGGSEANLTALVIARDQRPVEQWSKLRLYVSEHRHWSVDRAARIIGLQPNQIVPIPADRTLRLAPGPLHEQIIADRRTGWMPWAVIANAGATNTGTVDRLSEIAAIAKIEQIWLHVDAAYGWAAVLTDEGLGMLTGIAEADSVTFDPHKWFAQTIDAGGLLVRDGRLLAETFAMRPDYLQDAAPEGEQINFSDRGLALTRRFRSFKMWFSIQVLGLSWFRALVDRCMRLAEYAQLRLESTPGFEVICPRQLSIVCFRRVQDGVDLDRLNASLPAKLRETGRALISSTRIDGKVVLRMCFVNWRTTSEDVDEVIRLLE